MIAASSSRRSQHGALSRQFAELYGLDAPARAARLAEIEAADPAVAAELRELLELAAAPGALDDAGTLLTEAERPDISGRFRPDVVLGAGGGGVVWRAEQLRPVRRTIALKVSPFAAAGDEVRARIRFEGEALAHLQHEHIASIHEVGVTADDRPYLAMELVDGPAIDDYCTEHGLDVRARVALVAALCRGVAHAHSRAIIHRDIKPSNVLVTEVDGRPVPKLIDFGVARPLRGPLAERMRLTRTGQVTGTLAYLAPEQLTGGRDAAAPDVRTDVHGLGGLLHELITGEPPVGRAAVDVGDPAEVARRIRTIDPPRCSRIARAEFVQDAAAMRDLREELDWIVSRALAKQPADRYGTVAELAADLDRFLRHEAIVARPPSRRYKLASLWRRRRLEMTAAAAVGCAIIIGLSGTSAGLVAANRALAGERDARGEADDRAAELTAMNEFLTQDLLAGSSPLSVPGSARNLTVSEMVERARASIDERFESAPRVAAMLHAVIAEIDSTTGNTLASVAEAERAIELFESVGDEHRAAELRSALSNALPLVGRAAEAVPTAADALRVLRAAAAGTPADAPERIAVAVAAARLGALHLQAARPGDAEPLLREATEQLRVYGDPARREHLEVPMLYGLALDTAGRTAEGVDLIAATIERAHAAGLPRMAMVFMESMELALLAKSGQAEAVLDRANEVLERSRGLPPEHPIRLAVLNGHAIVLGRAGRMDEALATRAEAIALTSEVYGPEEDVTISLRVNQVKLLSRVGRLDEAISEGFALRELLEGDSTMIRARAVEALGVALEEAGRLGEAAEILAEAWALLGVHDQGSGQLTAEVASRLGRIHESLGDADEARRWTARTPGHS